VIPRALLADLHRAARVEVHAGRALERALAAMIPGRPFVLLARQGRLRDGRAARAALGARIARGVVDQDGHARAIPGSWCAGLASAPGRAQQAAGRRRSRSRARCPADETARADLRRRVFAVVRPRRTHARREARDATEPAAREHIGGALNAVRKHLSSLKGGGLLRAARGRRVRVYAISDVPGDALADIGSGPASPDPTRFGDALAAVRAWDSRRLAPALRGSTRRGRRLDETLKPGDPLAA
jgi:glycerate-2-kinase